MNTLLDKAFVAPLVILLSGALQTFSYAPYDLWVLGPLSLVLLLWATRALEPGVESKPILYGWLYGVGLFGMGVSWVYVSINTYGNASPALAGFLTILFVFGLALFQAFQFWLYFKIRTRHIGLNALVFLVVWIMSDAFRTDFLTGFPWLFLGYAHVESPLSGWAPVIGVYGITAIIVATALATSMTWLRTQKSILIGSWLTIAGLWIAGAVLQGAQWTTDTGKSLSAALIQMNIPQEQKWQPAQRRKTLKLLETMTDDAWEHDVIVWPETAIPMFYDRARLWLKPIEREAKSRQTNIISGLPYSDFDIETRSEIIHNSIVSFGEGEGINHKQKLVPFGEYVPLQSLLRGLIDFFDLPMSNFRPGPSDQSPLISKGFKVAPFICYEVVYPDFVAHRAADADYLLTISNDAWFGTSIGPLQHLQMAQMRALENGRYMVRSTNNGITAMINEKGQVIAQIPQFEKATLSSEIRVFEGRTPYSKTTSLPLFLLSTGLLFFFVLTRKRWQEEETNP